MAAQTYTVLFKNGRVTTVTGVQSKTITHEENFDNTNYRDDVSGGAPNSESELGPHAHVVFTNSVTHPSATADDAVNAPAAGLAQGIIEEDSSQPSGAETTTKHEYTSLSDVASHIPPRNESKKRSVLNLWSGAGGTGDLLFFGWCDRIEGYSIGTFSNLS